MTADREQTRRDAQDATNIWAKRWLALLAELEQAERSLIANRADRYEAERVGRISDMALEKALARAEQAERERDKAVKGIEDALRVAENYRSQLAAYEQDTQAAHVARGHATEERTG